MVYLPKIGRKKAWYSRHFEYVDKVLQISEVASKVLGRIVSECMFAEVYFGLKAFKSLQPLT